MQFTNLRVKTYPLKKSPIRTKDGRYQIKIRVFIGDNRLGKFHLHKKFDLEVIDDNDNLLRLTADEFKNIKLNKEINIIILTIEAKIQDAVHKIVEDKVKINAENLFRYVYKKHEPIDFFPGPDPNDEYITSADIKKFFEDLELFPEILLYQCQ